MGVICGFHEPSVGLLGPVEVTAFESMGLNAESRMHNPQGGKQRTGSGWRESVCQGPGPLLRYPDIRGARVIGESACSK